jgi:hypothetical protein
VIQLEIAVRIEVLTRIFILGTLSLTVFPGGTYFSARISTGSLFSSNKFSKYIVPMGSPGNNC